MSTAIALEPTTIDAHGINTAKLAGFTYVGAWVVGLTAFGVGPGTNAADAEIARYFADHRALSTAQSLLIHGVAALALLVVLRTAQRSGRSTALASVGGLAAVGLSLLQCGLDVYRSVLSTGSTTAGLVHSIDRIDGVKMLALAVMIGASVRPFRRSGMIGRKMAATGTIAVPALVVSGIAYAGQVTGLLASAELSLALLLVWVAYTGVALGRAPR
jgi:hypothetical protein